MEHYGTRTWQKTGNNNNVWNIKALELPGVSGKTKEPDQLFVLSSRQPPQQCFFTDIFYDLVTRQSLQCHVQLVESDRHRFVTEEKVRVLFLPDRAVKTVLCYIAVLSLSLIAEHPMILKLQVSTIARK